MLKSQLCRELKLCDFLILRLFRCGSKTRARNGDGIWCGRMVATPVATLAVPERRCPPALAILQMLGRQSACSTATACPRPRWRSYTPFITYTQASPLRSPFPTSTDDGLKWKRTLTVASPAILDEGSAFPPSRRNSASLWHAFVLTNKKSLQTSMTSLTYRGSRV